MALFHGVWLAVAETAFEAFPNFDPTFYTITQRLKTSFVISEFLVVQRR